MTDKPDALLWIDTETTAIDPREGDLLEIGLVCTSMDASETIATHHAVIHRDHLVIDRQNLIAVRMHLANGLLLESLDMAGEPTADRAEADLREFINTLYDQWALYLAGTNIQFDIDWINEHLPTAGIDDLSHRRMDVTSLRLALTAIGLDPYDESHDTDHRTSHCLARDIREYRQMIALLRDAAHHTDPPTIPAKASTPAATAKAA